MAKCKIMIVEDEAIVAEDLMETLVSSGYDVCAVVGSGEEAIRNAEEKVPDLVMLDIVLSGKMDGITTAGEIKSRFDIPIIYLTAHVNEDYVKRAMLTEPFGYLVKPFIYKELRSNIEMSLYKHKIYKELRQKNVQLQKMADSIISTIAEIVKLKNPFLNNHHEQVSLLSIAIAKDMNISEDRIEGIRLSASVHDLGMINIPYDILIKPTPLNEYEQEVYKSHVHIAYDLLKSIEFDMPVAKIVLQCCERVDGSGYPSGLKGKDILLEARIINVACNLCYWIKGRPSMPCVKVDEALEKLIQRKGIHFDSDVVAACVKIIKEKRVCV